MRSLTEPISLRPAVASAVAVESTARLLVVVAHPDDETLAVGGRLWSWVDATLVHITTGAPRDVRFARAAGCATAEEYAEVRSRELGRALDLAHVPMSQRRSLGYTDQEACFNLVDLYRTLSTLLGEIEPSVVITHPYEGGHPDHDTAAVAVQMAICGLRRTTARTQVPSILEAPFYHAAHQGVRMGRFLGKTAHLELEFRLHPEEQARKEEMLSRFVSQAEVLRAFPREFERFRVAPSYDFAIPPHAGILHYEKLGWPITGRIWRAAVRSALAELDMSTTPLHRTAAKTRSAQSE